MVFHESSELVVNQDPQSKVNIIVSYANHTSDTYTITADKNQKYTISQQNSWSSDNSTRFNLQGYIMDNQPYVPIQRTSQGNFTVDILTDSDHSIVFLSKQQFKIITSETNKIDFSPPSPTNDNWFDSDSDVQIIAPYVLQSDQNDTRKQLSGWSLDSSDINVITRQESGTFKSHMIHISSAHKIDLVYSTQYYVKVISNFGKVIGTGWYDSGTITYVSVMPAEDILVKHIFTGWQGQVIGSQNQESVGVMVDSPKIIGANWFVDYTNVIIIGIFVIAVVVVISIYQKRRTRQNHN
jgi:hypothetical protein